MTVLFVEQSGALLVIRGEDLHEIRRKIVTQPPKLERDGRITFPLDLHLPQPVADFVVVGADFGELPVREAQFQDLFAKVGKAVDDVVMIGWHPSITVLAVQWSLHAVQWSLHAVVRARPWNTVTALLGSRE